MLLVDLLIFLKEYFELFGAKKCWFDDMTIFFDRLVDSERIEVCFYSFASKSVKNVISHYRRKVRGGGSGAPPQILNKDGGVIEGE